MLKLIVKVQSVSRPDDAKLPLMVNFSIMEGSNVIGTFRQSGPQDGELSQLALGSNHAFVRVDLNADVQAQLDAAATEIAEELKPAAPAPEPAA